MFEGAFVGLSVPVGEAGKDLALQCGQGSGRHGGQDGLSCKIRRLIEIGAISLLRLREGVVGVSGCSVLCVVKVVKVFPKEEGSECKLWQGQLLDAWCKTDEWDGKRWIGKGLVFRGAGSFGIIN